LENHHQQQPQQQIETKNPPLSNTMKIFQRTIIAVFFPIAASSAAMATAKGSPLRGSTSTSISISTSTSNKDGRFKNYDRDLQDNNVINSSCEDLCGTNRPTIEADENMQELIRQCYGTDTTECNTEYVNDFIGFDKIGCWDTSNVKDFSNAFDLGVSDNIFFNEPLNCWDVSSATSMVNMFGGYWIGNTFNQPINNWDVSKVETMDRMFYNAPNFNQSLNNWDVSSVVDMNMMFRSARAFDQSLNDWDVSAVTSMINMFFYALAFDQPLNDWDVSSVVNMHGMFYMATNFDQSLNNWDVSSVKEMAYMYRYTHSYNQPLNDWDVSAVTSMHGMFYSATAFNQQLNNWDVSDVKTMNYMFYEADHIDKQRVVSWNWDISPGTWDYAMFGYTIAPSYAPTHAPTPKPVCTTEDVIEEFPINKDVNCAWVAKDAASNTINQCKKTSGNKKVSDQCPETCEEVGVGSSGGEKDNKGNFQILKGNFYCAYVAKGSDNRTRGECRKTSGNSKVWDQCPVTCGEVGEGSCYFLQQ